MAKTSRGCERAIEDLLDRRAWARTDDAADLAAIADEDEGRCRTHVEALRDRGICIDVDGGEPRVIAILDGERFEDRREGLTWTTPRRGEIDHEEAGRFEGLSIE